ncbi:MAG: lipoprotein, partial [Novosphingobium sp.]|uniref:lipoprotein n=1 Tax=Novosphingobium sp. TaxID=1874826 RepID=UPI0032B80D43
MNRLLFAAVAVLTLSACSPSKLAYGQVKSAMVDAGLSEANSACMAERMTDRLSLVQLQKLKQLKGEKK